MTRHGTRSLPKPGPRPEIDTPAINLSSARKHPGIWHVKRLQIAICIHAQNVINQAKTMLHNAKARLRPQLQRPRPGPRPGPTIKTKTAKH